MAFMSQERKKALAPAILAVCKKYGLKASLSVGSGRSLALTIAQGPIDFVGDLAPDPYEREPKQKRSNLSVNVYHYQSHFTGQALAFLSEAVPLMFTGNHDNSDSQTDYFDVGWYVYVYVGKWNKPYVLTSTPEKEAA